MLSIKNVTKRHKPNLPFKEITNSAMTQHYTLSLVFIGNVRSRTLNRRYRGRDKATNVLSFPLSKNEGEIFINLSQTKNTREVGELFIHGLMHLEGHRHGSTMERAEEKLVKKFLDDKKHSGRNRRRDIVHARRSN